MNQRAKKSGFRSTLFGSKAGFLLLMVVMTFALVSISCGDNKTESTAASDKTSAGNGGGSAGGSGNATKPDACAIVTQADATRLFGMPASPEQGTPVTDPAMLGECLWTWDTDMDNQLLQFRIWNGAQYYSDSPGSQPVDVGEKGNIVMSDVLGVDVTWLQDGKTYQLSYSTAGSTVPDPTVKAEEVKNLAKKVEGQI